MEMLHARLDSQEAWTLADDKDLLAALQDLSGSLLSSTDRLNSTLHELEAQASVASTSLSNASNRFRQLMDKQFIEQRVEQASETTSRGSQPSTSAAASITPANYKQVVYPKYREALKLAVQAFKEPVQHSSAEKPLPHIFGSPEYLQDARFGLGGHAPLAPSQPGSALKASTSGFRQVPDAEDDQEHSQLAQALPDFRSMLEAALQGGLDSLPSLAEGRDSPPSHADVTAEAESPSGGGFAGLDSHLHDLHEADDPGTGSSDDGKETRSDLWTPVRNDGLGREQSAAGSDVEFADEGEEEFESPDQGAESLEELLQRQAHLFSEDELGLQHLD